ncbi:MAG TPA: hypothetical protein VKV96_03470 [Roseiarcus sp.]|nr:hypothetical protein [Roseiarcus sp.]
MQDAPDFNDKDSSQIAAPDMAADKASPVSGAAGEAPPVSAAAPTDAEACPEPIEVRANAGSSAETPAREAPAVEPVRATLIPFVAPRPQGAAFGGLGRFAADRRFQTAAAAACLALIAVVAGGATLERASKSERESQRLAQAVSAMSARIAAMETAKPRDETAEIRKAVSEARGGLATSRDLSATIAQLNARLDRLEREHQARLDKLGDRLEHEVAARGADAQTRSADLAQRVDRLEKTDIAARLDKLEKSDLAARIDKLEKADFAARIDKVEKKVAAQTASAAAPLPPQKAAAASPGVSNEVTGSIERPHPTEPIRGWYLIEMRNGSAVVENRQGMHQIAPGDSLPGAGKVERFERRGREWVVVTDQGVIVQASAGSYAPRVVLRPPGYGPYGPGYDYED